MIKAKITVFDDETGRVYEENRLVVPDTAIPIPGCKTNTAYYFCFGVTVHENQETIDYSQRGRVL